MELSALRIGGWGQAHPSPGLLRRTVPDADQSLPVATRASAQTSHLLDVTQNRVDLAFLELSRLAEQLLAAGIPNRHQVGEAELG